ncbi:uncharacterized protein [Haliotis asinina]|uniref:uncharacterized protein n=1 Tax=Haliotis asinina TaxID=109174 RepID=UPI0035324079
MTSKLSILFLIAIGMCATVVRDVRSDSTSTSTSASTSTSTSTETGGAGNPEPQGPIEPNAAECTGDACDPDPELPPKVTDPVDVVVATIPPKVTEPATQCVEVTLPEGAVSGSRVYWKNPDGFTVSSATLKAGTSEGTCVKDKNYAITRKGGFFVKGCKGTFQLCP